MATYLQYISQLIIIIILYHIPYKMIVLAASYKSKKWQPNRKQTIKNTNKLYLLLLSYKLLQ